MTGFATDANGALVTTTDATGAKITQGFLRSPLGALVVPGGGTSSGPYVNAKTEGAKGDASVNDAVALQAAINKAAGGVLFLPRGRYRIDVVANLSLSLPGSIILMGEGDGTVIEHTGAADSATGNHTLFECGVSGARIEFRSLKISGPTLTGASATALNSAIFHSAPDTGTVVLRDAYVTGFAYGIRTWAGGAHRVDIANSRIEGANFITPGSMGINLPGGVGAELLCDNVDFSKTGETADTFHCHCVYLTEAVSAHFNRCRFDNVKGRYVQWFSGVGLPKYAKFTDCYFGPNIPVDVQGVMTNNQCPTTFENCTFDHPGAAVEVQGDCSFDHCEFRTLAGTAFYGAIDITAAGARVSVTGGIWPIVQQFVFKIEAVNVLLKVSDVVFTGTPTFQFSCRAAGAGSVIETENCTFLDNAVGGGVFDLQAACTLRLIANRFKTTKAAIVSNVTTPVLNAVFNDFSQTGATLSGSAPATGKRLGNYGSAGLADL